MQYVTDLNALSQRFAYPAAHPLVVSDCDGILYDPLKMATLPDGSWVRFFPFDELYDLLFIRIGGRVAASLWWFDRLADITPNHVISATDVPAE